MNRLIVFMFLFFLIPMYGNISAFAGEDPFREPCRAESFLKEDSIKKVTGGRVGDQSILNLVFIRGVRFFQNVISPVDGDRCPMYPSCSEYGIRALRKHGPFLGFVMIADRLIHERDEMTYASIVIVNGIRRYYDPVENNDFWLSEK
ncbi:MAG: membrane protein insertion efficiency factor YidD [Deltaproteobacteria bacterium]|jgi:hypothetical protein|nr:MAG: membrane protein insertion efficiency factor YidD [Deltaproteobacteria bacterium]